MQPELLEEEFTLKEADDEDELDGRTFMMILFLYYSSVYF
jgi:hypothetical protein